MDFPNLPPIEYGSKPTLYRRWKNDACASQRDIGRKYIFPHRPVQAPGLVLNWLRFPTYLGSNSQVYCICPMQPDALHRYG